MRKKRTFQQKKQRNRRKDLCLWELREVSTAGVSLQGAKGKDNHGKPTTGLDVKDLPLPVEQLDLYLVVNRKHTEVVKEAGTG